MIPYLPCIKIRVELMLLYYKASENHTINVLVLVGIFNARFIFTVALATTKLFTRIIFRAVLKFAHPALHEF